ncbi:MAG: DUF3822 family protein [Bacteroidales bacterium]|jgi:hypothetical protein|nr:DUF3822 family protein [Bacteroidales bacterium]MDD2204026.1 DUF3822 family protein [Bacteroidales bacterium]MDD3151620.1 DUF3822 family protein [Bacteroidales bacterium]MDD3913386.1 DUF3822 family protein [Bacteroidales bacterium]MDD4633181.1 DUF3822 family protein [Bacteroidales bacterium]
METGSNTFFDLKNINLYSLSVFLSKDGFSFAVFDECGKCVVNKSIIFSKSASFDIGEAVENIFYEYTFLKENFQSVKIVFNVDKYTFVPEEFFLKELVENYYTFNFDKLADNESVFYCFSPINNIYTIFAFDTVYAEIAEKYFLNADFFAGISNFIDGVTDVAVGRNSVFANVRNKSLDVVVFCNDKFTVANTFHVNSEEDIVYFLLRAFYNYKLDGSKDLLIIYGDVDAQSQVVDKISYFVKNFVIDNENNKRYL